MAVPGKVEKGRKGNKYFNVRRDVFSKLDLIRRKKGEAIGVSLSWNDFFSIWMRDLEAK
jgi:hypothetical protein